MSWQTQTAKSGFKLTSGRRRYNAIRTTEADKRRAVLTQMVASEPLFTQADAARALGVDAATISRDIARLKAKNGPLWYWAVRVDSSEVSRLLRNIYSERRPAPPPTTGQTG